VVSALSGWSSRRLIYRPSWRPPGPFRDHLARGLSWGSPRRGGGAVAGEAASAGRPVRETGPSGASGCVGRPFDRLGGGAHHHGGDVCVDLFGHAAVPAHHVSRGCIQAAWVASSRRMDREAVVERKSRRSEPRPSSWLMTAVVVFVSLLAVTALVRAVWTGELLAWTVFVMHVLWLGLMLEIRRGMGSNDSSRGNGTST
jgi:hypothetical protein